MTKKVTSRQGDAAQLDLLQNDLRRLVRTTKRNVEPADFPSIRESTLVRREADRLGLSLDLRDDFLEILHELLKARANEEEQAADAELFPAGTVDNWEKFRVAEPAIALLGLSRATASMKLGDRRIGAARSRSRGRTPVADRTIANYNHEPVILEEVALLLSADDLQTDEDAATITLETLRQQSPPDFDHVTGGLSKSEIRRLAVEFVASYGEFSAELARLRSAVLPWSLFADKVNELGRPLGIYLPREPFEDISEIETELVDEDYFPSLHAYANRKLDNANLCDFSIALNLAEKDSPRSRFGWLARVLDVLHCHLIAFGPRGWALLSHASDRAAGNFHVFLETMEDTQFGQRTLQLWADDFRPQSYTPVTLSHTHHVWLTGLSAAQLLIAPRQLTEKEKKSIIRWIFDNAADEDADQIAKLMHPASEPAWWEFQDRQDDIAFLKVCAT